MHLTHRISPRLLVSSRGSARSRSRWPRSRRRPGAPARAAAAAPPPTAVTILTLEQKPVEQASDFIATVRSLRSTTVQPEVDGLVTQIFVKSGDQVRAGAPLVQIDPDKQQATRRAAPRRTGPGAEADVQVLAAAGRAAGVAASGAGAISQNEFDQAQNSPAHGRSAARRARRAGPRGPRPAAVLPRRRAAGRAWSATSRCAKAIASPRRR